MKKVIEKLMNQQLALEFESFYAYLGMASYFESIDYVGFAHWMHCQSKEELSHFQKIFDFVHELGGQVELKPVKASSVQYKSILDAFETSLKQEKKVTQSIYKIYDQCLEEKAFASFKFLDWFIEEQVEEESEVSRLVEEIRRIDYNPSALFMLDRELGQRELEDDH